ncbi:hypothetical protein DQP56_23655, partial [Mycolicibacter senuensis]
MAATGFVALVIAAKVWAHARVHPGDAGHAGPVGRRRVSAGGQRDRVRCDPGAAGVLRPRRRRGTGR